MKLVILVFTLCFALTYSLPNSPNSEGEWIPGGIVGPIKNLIKEQTSAILNSLKDQVENLSHTAKLHITILAGLIRPHVKKLIEHAKVTGKSVEELTAELSEVVKNIIGSIWKITEENANAVKALVKYIVNVILNDFRPNPPKEDESYSLINNIVGELLETFLNEIEKPIVKIDELIENKSEIKEEVLKKFRDTVVKVFKEPIIKLSDFISNVVGGLENAKSIIKKKCENYFDKLKGMSIETISILKNVVDEVLESIKKEKVEKEDSYLIIDKAISLIFKPIIDKINTQLEAIKRSMIENKNNLKETINKHAENLAELIRPYMIRVINLLNDLGADGKTSLEQMKKLLNIIIKNISGISQANKEIFLSLIDYMSKILAGKLPEEIGSYDLAQYHIKDSVALNILVEGIVKPLATVIKQQIFAISQSLKDQAGNLSETAKQHLKQLAFLLKPIVERIIKNGSGIIDASKDMKDQVLQALKHIFGIIGEIPGVSAELLADILKYLVEAIVGKNH